MDIAAQLSDSWHQFADDLWLVRRTNVYEILQHLRKLESGSRDDPVVSGQLADLMRFFNFLASECSGSDFTMDKQWSELLNIMEISKKLNHRTVRLKDIMRNRPIIEANAKYIQRLNAVARLVQSIEKSIEEMIAGVQSLKLEVPAISQRNPEDIEMIKKLTATKNQLQDKCQPSIRALRIELNDSLMGEVERLHVNQLHVWQATFKRYESSIGNLQEFLDTFLELESSLATLRPLMSVSLDGKGEIEQQQVTNAIQECKQEFQSVIEFRLSLITSLQELASRSLKKVTRKHENTTSLPLAKMLNDRSELVDPTYSSRLPVVLERLKTCQSKLEKIMQNLRLEFGRFYFVSDFELLSIIALDTRLILEGEILENRRLISKLHNNTIESFVVRDNQFIVGVKSTFGEIVMLNDDDLVPIRKKVNVYSVEIVRVLNEVARKLRRCLRTQLLQSLNRQEDVDSIDWNLHVQLLVVSEFIKFTRKVEFELETHRQVDRLLDLYEKRLESNAEFVDQPSLGLDWLIRFKRSAIISLSVHFMSILSKLKAQKITRSTAWLWQSQLRYYVRGGDQVEVRIADASFEYKFDYLNLQTDSSDVVSTEEPSYRRLVSTRITDNCMLVASYAVSRLRLGANPFGPAGCGKTETIKALGQLVGCQVIVHNCDESNESSSLERLILGLAHLGLWGCFDEFNRLSKSVLSSVSGLLEQVQTGLREGRPTVELTSGHLVCVDPSSAFFITMNPGDGSRYLGRRQLPANLRSLFLPVSMSRVEVSSIVMEFLMTISSCRSMPRIQSQVAMDLGDRLNRWLLTMKSSPEISNANCQWDLRLVMAILKRLKHNNNAANHSDSHQTYEQLLAKSTLHEIEPRLTSNEHQVAVAALGGCFNIAKDDPKADVESTKSLRDKILENLGNKHPERDAGIESLVNRAIQLDSQLEMHTGVLLLGPTKSGKSSLWRALGDVKGDAIKWFALNPKSCDKHELIGYSIPETRKWVDGSLTAILRKSHKLLQTDVKLQQVWIVLDGPIDPDWIECFNSVLDDNRTMTLDSGERLDFCIPPNKHIKLIFESCDADFASPATISRLGLVLFEKESGIDKRKECDSCHILNDLNDINAQVEDSKSRFLVIECLELATRQSCVGILRKRKATLVYNCSKYSRANHLVDMLARSEGFRCFIINNVHLIQSEDSWKSRSIIEALRYIATYGGYYKSNDFTRLTATFILTVDSVEHLDSRLISRSQWVKIAVNSPETELTVALDHIDQFIERLQAPGASAIASQSDGKFGSGRRMLLLDAFRDWKIHTFDCSTFAKSSLAAIRQLSNAKQTKVSADSVGHVFILSDLECRLLSKTEFMGSLLHELNWLCSSPGGAVRFVHLSHDMQSYPEAQTFWSSMGSTYCIKLGGRVESTIELCIKKLVSKLESLPSKYSPSCIDWILDRLEAFPLAKSVNLRDTRRYKSFIEAILQSTDRYLTSIDVNRRTLDSGLNRLADFEMNVNKVRRRLEKEDETVQQKGNRIQGLLEAMNHTLEESREKKVRLDYLRAQREVKSRSVRDREDLIAGKLAGVASLVEQSKREIQQHLRPEALNEIKTLRSPPKTVKDILDILFVLLEQDNSTWAATKAYLARSSLREELSRFNFDKRMNRNLLAKVENEIANRADSFNARQAERASSAVVPLMNWIKSAIVYGKVLVELKPLTDEMDKLAEEERKIRADLTKLIEEQAEIDACIASNSKEIEILQTDLETSKEISRGIRLELQGAERVRLELNDQVDCWIRRLDILQSLLKGHQIAQLSMISAYLAIYHEASSTDTPTFDWCEFFGVQEEEKDAIVSKLWALLNDDCNFDENVAGRDDFDRVLSLLSAKILLSYNSGMILFFNTEGEAREEELRASVAYREILQGSDKIAVLRCNQTLTDISRQLDTALRLNQMVIMQLESATETRDLDIVSLTRANKSVKLVAIAGQGSKHPSIEHLVRTIDISTSHRCMERAKGAILQHLIQVSDPQLHRSMQDLDLRLRRKRGQIKEMELKLLRRLASLAPQDTGRNDSESRGADGICEDLVKILSELHKSSQQLADDMTNLNAERRKLLAKQSDHLDGAEKAASFYVEYLADLDKIDKFYHVSLNRFMQLLGYNLKSLDSKNQLDFSLVVSHVLCSMRPEDRNDFERKLAAASPDYWIGNVASTFQVEHIVHHLLTSSQPVYGGSDLDTEESDRPLRQSNKHNSVDNLPCKLMVVLHEATKPNPQVDIDKLMSKLGSKCSYRKVYASSDSSSKLEAAFNDILSAQEPAAADGCLRSGDRDTNRVSTPRSNPSIDVNVSTSRCLCIANALLSADWMNTRLVEMMKSPPIGKEAKLIILVAESPPSRGARQESDKEGASCFDIDLIDLAQVRYWHDELAMPLTSRYRALCSMLLEPPYRDDGPHDMQQVLSSRDFMILSRQLVLFHVVCQELTKPQTVSNRRKPPMQEDANPVDQPIETQLDPCCWSKSYSFDHDQLYLAFRILNSLNTAPHGIARLDNGDSDSLAASVRRSLCNYLETLVYGSRMEFEEDEALLVRLLERLVYTREKATEQVDKLDSWLARNGQVDTSCKPQSFGTERWTTIAMPTGNNEQRDGREEQQSSELVAELIAFAIN